MLIKITNTESGVTASIALDKNMTLQQARLLLEDKKLMSPKVMFVYEGSSLFMDSEKDVTIEELLGGSNEIKIGKGGEIDQSYDISKFTELNNSQIIEFFRKKQLCRGYIFSQNSGITKSFSDIFTLNAVPKILTETQNTYSSSDYAFSKQSCDISLITSNKASLCLNGPYVNASAEYEKVRSEKKHSEKIKEYLLTKFVVSLMSFQVDPTECLPTEEFIRNINNVMTAKIENEYKIANLLKELDKYGFYIPIEFTMGGALYASETTEIEEFSKAESEKQEFSAKVDATFCGYGGGASFFESSTEEKASASSSKYKNIEVKQIGGIAGNTENKEFFKNSLNTLSNWAIVDIKKFYPSILLLIHADKFDGINPLLFIKTQKLLTEYCMHDFVKKSQPFINMEQYLNSISSILRTS